MAFEYKNNENHNNHIDAYMSLLNSLSNENKLEIISRLTKSIETEEVDKKSILESVYGAWVGNETAEEIIEDIRSSRLDIRVIEEF